MDFDGNELVAIKYNAFTLCYSKLLAHLDDFDKPLRRQTQLKEDIWARFDSVLQEDIYKASPKSFVEATELMIDGLRVKRKSVATINPGVAEVIATIIDDIETDVPTWQYRDDVGRWQALGQELAQRFYADSPHAETQKRLGRDVALDFEWVGETLKAPFGYREDCLAEAEEPVPGIIMVRFSFQDKFINYLAYPFFFLHEYVSHAYAVNTRSELFEDGWLLFAANNFFGRQYHSALIPELKNGQVDVFERHLLQHLREKAKDGYFMAKHFGTWCLDRVPECFTALTHELAALAPNPEMPHSDFIYLLCHHRKERPDTLLRWLERAKTCRELWPWLQTL